MFEFNFFNEDLQSLNQINNNDNNINNDSIIDSIYVPVNNDDNQESIRENQSDNLSCCPYIDNTSLKNSNSNINASIKLINEEYFIAEENSKFMLYLKNNNLLNENSILKDDENFNREKKMFSNKINDIKDKMKCIVCSKIPNQFYICSLCKSIFCEECLGNNKDLKFCIICNRIISKNNFINIPIFNKILNYIDSIKNNNENLINNKIQNNLDKNVILCSEKIHRKKNKPKKEMNINSIFNSIRLNFKGKDDAFCSENDDYIFDKKIEIKAVYFCMECSRPFCSDCILNYKLNKKNNENNENNNIINEDKTNNSDNKKDICNINDKKDIDNKDNEKDINNNDNNIIINNINNNLDESKDNMKNNVDEKNKINDNENEHNCNHHIFRIDLLKDIGIFDLLYEKNMSEIIISEIESIDTPINNKINYLMETKQNMILFLDYVKNLYIEKVDKIINKLKNVIKEKTEKMNIIKQKKEELTNFLTSLKTKNDLKNMDNIKSIKQFLVDFNSYHNIPYEIKYNTNSIMKFKGIFNLTQLKNVYLNFNINDSLNKKIVVNNAYIKIKHEKIKQLDNLDNLNKIIENKNIINEEEYVNVIYKTKRENEYKKKDDFFCCPILINNYKKEFILFKEMEKNNNIIKAQKNKKLKKDKIWNNNYDDDNDNVFSFSSNHHINFDKNTFNEKTKYYADINVNAIKKISDEHCNVNLDIYNLNIF